MVGYDSKLKNINQFDYAFAGAASGFITRAFCQPLDVIKIRFQLQVEPISATYFSKYQSFYQAIGLIAKEERIKAFWKGHVPAQWLSIFYGLGNFWCLEVTTKLSHDLGWDSHKGVSNFVCGSISGVFATIISFPFDVVRTRLVAQSDSNKVYKGVIHTLSCISRNQGNLFLFRGLWPTIIQVAPHTGVKFMTFKLFESFYAFLIPNSFETRTSVLKSSAICGCLSGLCAKAAIYPLDLAKKRMQIQGFDRKTFGKNFQCTGLIDCIQKTYKFEGLTGLYKGLYPSLIKAVATTALHFTSYNLICYEISHYRELKNLK